MSSRVLKVILAGFIGLAGFAQAENSVELSLSAIPKPGQSAYFHLENNASGVSSRGGGILSHSYTGYYEFKLNGEGSVGDLANTLTGRLASFENEKRLGFGVDNFILLRSYFDERLLHVLTSGKCPNEAGFSNDLNGKTYNYLFVRNRTVDSPRSPQNALVDHLAGTFSLNTGASQMVSGSQMVNLSSPESPVSASGLDLITNPNLSCTGGGQMLFRSSASAPWDPRMRLYFGKNMVLGMSGGLYSADPLVMVAVPQQALTDAVMINGNEAVAKNAFVTLFSSPDSYSNPVLREVAVLPDKTATLFKLKEMADIDDSKSGVDLGTITCPRANWNVPFPGACHGQFTYGGLSAKSLCMFSKLDSQIMMACVAQNPQDNRKSVTLVGTFPTKATLVVEAPVFTPSGSETNCASVKLSNPTPRYIPTISAGSDPDSTRAYWDSRAFTGKKGNCGNSLAPFSSCESTICTKLSSGDPDRAKKYLFTIAYSEEGQAPSVAASDYSSVVQLPSRVSIKPSAFSCGSFPAVQYINVDARYPGSSKTSLNGVIAAKNLLKIEKSGVDIEVVKVDGLTAVRLNSMPSASGAARLVVTLGGVPYKQDLELCGSNRSLLMKGLTSVPPGTLAAFSGYLRNCCSHYKQLRPLVDRNIEAGGSCSELNSDLSNISGFESCSTQFEQAVDSLNALLARMPLSSGALRAAILDFNTLGLLMNLSRSVLAGGGVSIPALKGADHDLVCASDANTKTAVAVYGQTAWLCRNFPSSPLADVGTVVDTSLGVLGIRR